MERLGEGQYKGFEVDQLRGEPLSVYHFYPSCQHFRDADENMMEKKACVRTAGMRGNFASMFYRTAFLCDGDDGQHRA